MSMKHNNGGFTLVEMLVTIAIGSMITIAATSMLLLGLRIHHQSNVVSAQQNTVNALYTVLNTIASEQELTVTESADGSWVIRHNGTVAYSKENESITINGADFLKNVTESTVMLDEETDILTVCIKTEISEYEASVWCKVKESPE